MIPEAALVIALHAPTEAGERPDRTPAIIAAAAKVPPRWRQFARCVVNRESHGNARARNPHSSAQGKFQYLDRLWRYSLAGMVADRLRAHGMSKTSALEIRDALRRREIATWAEKYQDVGFAATITVPGNWRHWYLAGSPCNGLAS